jgi:hypothetical protein
MILLIFIALIKIKSVSSLKNFHIFRAAEQLRQATNKKPAINDDAGDSGTAKFCQSIAHSLCQVFILGFDYLHGRCNQSADVAHICRNND